VIASTSAMFGRRSGTSSASGGPRHARRGGILRGRRLTPVMIRVVREGGAMPRRAPPPSGPGPLPR
jgi:hypothetical protein